MTRWERISEERGWRKSRRGEPASAGKARSAGGHPGKGEDIPWVRASTCAERVTSEGSCRKSAPGLLVLVLENQDSNSRSQEGQENGVTAPGAGLGRERCPSQPETVVAQNQPAVGSEKLPM